ATHTLDDADRSLEVLEESNKLKEKALVMHKLQELLVDPGDVLDMFLGNVATVEQEVAATVASMEKASRYTLNKYVEAALNSATVVLPYLVTSYEKVVIELLIDSCEMTEPKIPFIGNLR
nr:hypothetical protein [Tanacetum cinerariifolium]